MHERALFQAVLDAPDDDAPRLVFADWLEEQGDPWAQFIRWQVAMAHESPGGVKYRALAAAALSLEEAHGRRWRPVELASARWGEFRRGFLGEAIPQSWPSFLEDLPRIFERAPIEALSLQQAEIRGRIDDLSSDVSIERLLTRIKRLDLSRCRLDDQSVEPWIGSDVWRNVRSLNLAKNRVGSKTLRLLSRSPMWSRLESLDLSGNDVGAMIHLRSAAASGRLKQLYLSNCRLTAMDLADLADSPCMAEIETLDLSHNHLHIGAASSIQDDRDSTEALIPGKILAQADWAPNLRTLDVNGCHWDDRDFQWIAASPAFSGLKILRASHNEMTSVGAEALLRSEHLRSLDWLSVQGNPLDEAAVARLRERFEPGFYY